jgi:hypothetical protein
MEARHPYLPPGPASISISTDLAMQVGRNPTNQTKLKSMDAYACSFAKRRERKITIRSIPCVFACAIDNLVFPAWIASI